MEFVPLVERVALISCKYRAFNSRNKSGSSEKSRDKETTMLNRECHGVSCFSYLVLRMFCVTWAVRIYLNDDLLFKEKMNIVQGYGEQYLMSFISMLSNRLRTKRQKERERERRIKRGIV